MKLENARILIVEDNPMIAMSMAYALERAGCIVLGPAARVETAMPILEANEVDGALLDIGLGDSVVFAVADSLQERGIPFIFATGHGLAKIPPPHSGRPLIHKPFTADELVSALAKVLERTKRRA